MLKGIIIDFKKFALRGSLIDMAIGFTVGAGFSAVAKSLVNDIIMPPVGWLLGRSDFSDLYAVLKVGTKSAPPYTTLAEAQAAGAVTINYGLFINSLLAFLVVAAAMFMIIRFVNRAEAALEAQFAEPAKAGEPTEKKCPYCLSTIHAKARRCPFCTSEVEHNADPGSAAA